MPLTRYQIRNEYSLADPELYRAADKDDPEALLEGVAMAGLVGVLRQLGDLAEFAAEIFHDLHEEVMATAARGHGLMVRVQQLEAEVPSVEKAFLSQTSHSTTFYDTGIDWRPNLPMNQNLITREDLPRFVMDSYEECRGPPRLFLLDKFDVGGAGACLKRYTDPSFFKVEASYSEMTNAEVHREKKIRKAKKKGSRWRNGETPDVLPTSNSRLHQLFLDEHVENGINGPARRVKLKRRLNGFPFDSRTGKSYMEKILKSPSPEHKEVREISVSSSPLKLPSAVAAESGLEILEISTVSPGKESSLRKRNPYSFSSPNLEETLLKPSMDELNEEATDGITEMPNANHYFGANNSLSTLNELVDEKEIAVDGENKGEGSRDGYKSDDIASEIDNYMDALTTMESDMETDTESRAKNDLGVLSIEKQGTDSDANEEQHELQAEFSDSQSLGNCTGSDNGSSSAKKEISSFSYSDSLSNLAENTISDGAVSVEVSPSTEIWEAEIADISSDQHSDKDETPATQLPVQKVVSDGDCIEVAEIPIYSSEFGKSSSSSNLTDAVHTHSHMDTGATLREEDSLLRPKLDVISSDCNELVSGLINAEENGTNLGDNVPCSSNLSDVPSQERDNSLTVASTENRPVDELDDEDPNVFSDASLLFSKILVPDPEKRSENILDDVPPTGYSGDCFTKNLVDSQIDSPLSVSSHNQEQPAHSISPELEIYDPDLQSDGITFIVDKDAILSAGEIAVNKNPAVCSPQTRNYTEHLSETTYDVPPLELNCSEACISYSGEKHLDSHNSPDPGEIELPVGGIVTEAVQLEVVTVASAASVTEDDGNDNGNNAALPQKRLEVNEACLPKNLKQSRTEKEGDQQAVASPDLDSKLSNTVSHDSNSELPNDVSVPSMAEDAENNLYHGDASTASLYSFGSGQYSESKPPHQGNRMENSEDSLCSPSHCLPELGVPLKQKVELKDDQLDVESRHGGEARSHSSFQVEQIQSPTLLDHERCFEALEISHAYPPSPPIVSEFFPQSGSHKFDVSQQALDPLRTSFPAFGLLPDPTHISWEEMPPLPPLPPMQWRLGKTQHTSLPSQRDLGQNNLDHFHGKANLGFTAPEGEISQPPNVFLPLSAVKDAQHVYANLAGTTVHSSPLPSQLPTMVDHGIGDHDFLTSGRGQSTNPYLPQPAVDIERSENSFHAAEGRTEQPSLNPFSTVTDFEVPTSTYASSSLEETVIQPPPQLSPERTLESENLMTSTTLEDKVVNPPDTNLPPPRVKDEQPQQVFPILEGETAWSSSTSSPLPDVEDGNANGIRPMKLPRPRNPLIDAVVAHDKSKLRKVMDRVQPQIGQKVDERDSLLQQIRTKSFNLKPAVVTRPSIQGPNTNLKVAAILEKANAIRQALAGSDEDDDPDSWSDS